MQLKLSQLNKTWIIDIDGTILKHNGHLLNNEELIDGVSDFFKKVSKDDFVILLTARSEKYKESTELILKKMNIRYNQIIFGMPFGERILINDKKVSGLLTAYSVNVERDSKWNFDFEIDETM